MTLIPASGGNVTQGEQNGDPPASPNDAPTSGEFVQLFTRSQRRLYLFILAQVPNPVDADEILQETNLVIWRKCDQFRPGSNFLAWASQIAKFEVFKHRDRRRRERIYFSDAFIEQVAEDVLRGTEELERRRKALTECIEKLRPQDRELIQRRYAPGETGKGVAKFLRRPVNSVYQSLGRIRRTLMECIHRRLAVETGQ